MCGGTCALWGAWILGERYGKSKIRERDRAASAYSADSVYEREHRNSIRVDDHEFQEVLKHVKGDFKEAFKEWIATH